MQLRVLGPVEASADHRSLPLGGAKQRSVIAMLGLDANRTVSADRLIEGLWGEDAPPSAAKMVQNYVWRLRSVLGDDSGAEILTRGRGYELRIDPDAVDARRFERLLEAGRAARSGPSTDAAREALALWRGPPLADVADEPFAASQIRRLEELRLEATELAIDADLAVGRHAEVAAEIEGLIAEHPLRERLHGQRMLALYRCGRQAEALEAFRDARRVLVEQIGVEPGPELRRLHDAILRQDAGLEIEAATLELPQGLAAAASTPIVGRADALGALRTHWRRTLHHDGALIALVGSEGMGKTRLAAELATIAHGDGATVLYASGTGAPEQALAVVARASAPVERVLLVVDDADRAGADMRAAIGHCGDAVRARATMVLATGRTAVALAALAPDAAIELGPLDGAAVREIAALYAPAGGATGEPGDDILDESRGVPRRVHDVAREWARREAARRVGDVADRAAVGRARARALEQELTDSVEAMQSTRARSERLSAPDSGSRVVCPFKGLTSYDVEDAEHFFGREQLVAELVARLVGAPLLAVVGPSGSGKSSVVRAGLVPALAAGVLPGSDGWTQVLIRPGDRPAHELRRATAGLDADRRAVIAVDQFEEAFTVCRDEQERDVFVSALLQRAEDPRRCAVVVLALRADFYARCAAYPELARLVGANNVIVGPMSRDEVRRAIALPAERVGLRVDADLEDAMIADVEGQPGALPLLSTALLELWQLRRGRRLQLAAYQRTGGVLGAVARLAEDAFRQLQPVEQAAARKLLLRLADEDERGAVVCRRIPLSELGADGDRATAHALGVLTEHRLLTVSAGAVEVAHEALLREWPRLRDWLEEDAEGRHLHRQLAQAASRWREGGRDRADLYRGARLASALEWRSGRELELDAGERLFLDASRSANEQARHRARFAFAGVVGLLVVAVVAAVLALESGERARRQATAAVAQRLGAQALNEPTLDRSLLLARQGVALDDTPGTRDSLLDVLSRNPAAVGVMRGDGDGIAAAALHPDGHTLAVGDFNGSVAFLDARTRRRIGELHQTAPIAAIESLAFSPDGQRLAIAGEGAQGGFVELAEGRAFRSVTRLDPGDPLWETVLGVQFSPDSRVLAAQTAEDGFSSTRLLRWDARTGARIGGIRQIPGRASSMLGYLGARRLVTSSAQDRATVVRDAVTLRRVRRFGVAGPVAAMSRSARMVAFGSRSGSVRLLDLRSGALRTAEGGHDGGVSAIGFSADGRRLLTAGRDERLLVWDTARAAATESLDARGRGPSTGVMIGRDARTAYSAGRDGTVVVWDLEGSRRMERPFASEPGALRPRALSVAVRGAPIAVADADGRVELFDGRSLRRIGRIALPGGRKGGVALSPDGGTLAAVTTAGVLGFWAVRSGRPLGDLQPAGGGSADGFTFSPDGRWLTASGGGNLLRLWDARRRVSVGTLERSVADVSFSRDGTTLALTLREENFNGGLEILAVPSLEVIRTVPAPPGTVGRFSRDGTELVYGDRQGRVWIYDTRTWRPTGSPLRVHGAIVTADVSPDGRLLATTSLDGTARLWDLAARRTVGGALPSGSGDVVGAAFSADGSQIVVAHDRGGYIWDVRRESWNRHACDVAGRRLTRSEWEDALPGRDYAPAC